MRTAKTTDKLQTFPVFTQGRKVILPLMVVVAFVFFFGLLAEVTGEDGPFTFTFDFNWGWPGETRLVIPLLGEVKAYTHHWPVVLSLTVERIDTALLQHELTAYTHPNHYLQELLPRLQRLFYLFLFKLVLLGAVAGGMVALLLGRRELRLLWRAMVAGFLVILLVLGGVALDYNEEAFKTPRYEGVMEFAPWVLGLIDQGLTYLPELSERLSLVAGNMDRLVTQMDLLTPLARADGELKILHVSDIHNNPAAFEFIERIAEGFGVDLIVDTGDLTDYGTALETKLAGRIKTLDVPYLFIPGNHDSPEVIDGLQKLPNTIVLEKGIYNFRGLTILGWEDPAVRDPATLLTEDDDMQKEAELLLEYSSTVSEEVDVLAVHNIKLAEGLTGQIPVILYGHNHRAAVQEIDDTIFVNAGTSGAAGLRGLENEALPYSVALLRFDRRKDTAEEPRFCLSAVDLVRVYSLDGKFILERKVIEGAVNQETNGGEGE